MRAFSSIQRSSVPFFPWSHLGHDTDFPDGLKKATRSQCCECVSVSAGEREVTMPGTQHAQHEKWSDELLGSSARWVWQVAGNHSIVMRQGVVLLRSTFTSFDQKSLDNPTKLHQGKRPDTASHRRNSLTNWSGRTSVWHVIHVEHACARLALEAT